MTERIAYLISKCLALLALPELARKDGAILVNGLDDLTSVHRTAQHDPKRRIVSGEYSKNVSTIKGGRKSENQDIIKKQNSSVTDMDNFEPSWASISAGGILPGVT